MKKMSSLNANIIDMEKELSELLHISHASGMNPRAVQAGGGNTSVKCADGKSMIIKASGTPLSGMSSSKGWVCVDMDKIREIFANKDLAAMASGERESAVLGILYDAVITPAEARPSVETPLHVLLERVVIHTHPVAANGITCHPRGEELMKRVMESFDSTPAMWVPYTDPGAFLAISLAEKIEEYKKTYNRIPSVIFQQNHGIFISAPTVEECVQKHNDILLRIEKFLLEQLDCGIDSATQEIVTDAISRFGQKSGLPMVSRFSSHPSLIEAARGDLKKVFDGALSPDHVVYIGPKAVTTSTFTVDSIEEQVTAFHKEFGIAPRMIILSGKGFVLITEKAAKLDAAEALAVSAVETAKMTGGAVRFLTPRDVSFIMNWEAEHYRAKQ